MLLVSSADFSRMFGALRLHWPYIVETALLEQQTSSWAASLACVHSSWKRAKVCWWYIVFAHESFTKISPLKDFRFNHKSACSERSLLLIQLKGMLIHVPECVGRSAFLVQRCRVWHVCWKPVSLSPSCQVDCLFYTLVLRMFLISFMEMKWCALDNTGWL